MVQEKYQFTVIRVLLLILPLRVILITVQFSTTVFVRLIEKDLPVILMELQRILLEAPQQQLQSLQVLQHLF